MSNVDPRNHPWYPASLPVVFHLARWWHKMAFHNHVDVEFLDLNLDFRERVASLVQRVENSATLGDAACGGD